MSQPVSCEARRTFWPRRPMASDSCSSGTTTSMRSASSSSTTLATSAGCSALTMKVAASGDHGMMSIFSPWSSLHHRLDAAAAHADAGADRIDRGIARDHGDLGAAARIAGDRLHLDDAVIDLRHFLGEQLGHELRMGARQEDLRPALLAADVVDIGADAVAVAEGLARDQLVAAHDAFAAAEVDDDVAVLDALDLAVDDLADAVLVLVVLAVALGLAHLLDDDLLGRLGGDAAEIHRRQRLGDEVADLGGRIPARARPRRVISVGRVLDLLDHLEQALQPDLAGLGVDLGADVGLRAVARARRLLDRVLHRRRSRSCGRSTSRGRPRRRSAGVPGGWR